MPDIRFGSGQIDAVCFGSDAVDAVYFGSTQVWPSGLTIGVPVDAVEWTDYAPGVFAGVNLAVPGDAMSWLDFAPEISLGDIIPADDMDWTDYAPVVAGGAHQSVPADATVWSDFAPVISISATVPVPADAMEWADYAPVVVSGGAVEVASDEAVMTEFAPSISAGVNLAIPASLMDWRDFGVIAGYGFSTGFSSGFTAIPGASGATIPAADGMEWEDFAPEVDAATQIGFSFIEGDTELTGLDIGEAAEDRYVFALVFGSRLGNTSLVSATIGGVTAKIHVQRTMNTNGPVYRNVALISALVPTGTTADIVPTYSATTSTVGAAICRVTGLISDDAVDTSSSTVDTTRTWNRDLGVPAGGFVLAGGDLFGGIDELYSLDMTKDYQDPVFRLCAFSSLEAADDEAKSFRFRNGDDNALCSGPFVMASFR